LDAANEDQQRALPVEADGPAGLSAVTGAEECVVDTRGHDPDPGGIGPVQLGDLGGLHRTGGQHGVRTADDGRLGLRPTVGGVGLDLLRTGLGLDPVERVEGRHQGKIESVLDHMTRHAAQPVVGMYGVEGHVPLGTEVAGPLHGFHDAIRKLLDDGGQRLFGHGAGRPGRDVVDPEPGFDVDHSREVFGPRPGEHVAGHAGPGQGRRELADVHVHAATVPGARLGQG